MFRLIAQNLHDARIGITTLKWLQRTMKQQFLVLSTTLVFLSAPTLGAERVGGYAGVEFLGSSLISKSELQKILGLKPGASYESVAKAAARLDKVLSERHIKANVDVANDKEGIIVTVDVSESGSVGPPIRKLDFPRHIVLSSEVPFQIYDELLARRDLLASQGRAVTESYPEGIKRFSDEPCNQYAEKLLRRVPHMIDEFLTVIASDPDPTRRSRAIEVLNWAGDYPELCFKLLPAVNDGSEQVRASVTRFIYPRLHLLPDDFPFEDLIEVFSQQLTRPSHIDRMLALRCLSETARLHPFTLYMIKEYDLERLKQLDSFSVVQSIKEPAHQLLQILISMPEKPEPKRTAPITEF